MEPVGSTWLEVWIQELSQDLMNHGQAANADQGKANEDNQREHLAVSKRAAENQTPLGQTYPTKNDCGSRSSATGVSLVAAPIRA